MKGGGSTLIFSYIHRLRAFLGIKNFESHLFGGFQKNEYFLAYEDFGEIFLGVITKLDYIKGSFLCI